MNHKLDMSYSSPRWTNEIADCALPVTFDTYSNCSFGCVYCFSQFQRGLGGGKEDYFSKKVKSVNPKKVIDFFKGKPSTQELEQFRTYINDRKVIQWGGLSDQFDGFERKYGITLEIMKYLRQIEYPLSFSTKATWPFHDERYRKLFEGADFWDLKVSIITLDENDAKEIEVGVPSPQERLKAMQEYKNLTGRGATLRLRPFIPGVSTKTYKDLIRAAKAHGAKAVSTEFLCLEMRSINHAKEHYRTMSKVAGFDLVDFYRKHSLGTGYLRLNRNVKRNYMKEMEKLCKELGMEFYVSDAHFKELSCGSCCCGLNEEWNYSRGQFAEALQIAKKNGEVKFSDIEKHMKYFDFEWGQATGYNTNSMEKRAKFIGMTMKDYLRYLWNEPKEGQGPYKIFERALTPTRRDENGDLVYKYTGG